MKRNASRERASLFWSILGFVISLIAGISALMELWPLGTWSVTATPSSPLVDTVTSTAPVIIVVTPSPSPTSTVPTPNDGTSYAVIVAEMDVQETRIAALEDTLRLDPQNAVTLILLKRDIEELSEDFAQLQGQISSLWTLVIGTWVGLLLIAAGAIIPFVLGRLRTPEEARAPSDRSNSQE